jgi:hypothetical protein
MAYSYVVYTGNGSTTQFSVAMPYIRKEHVHVYVNYVEQSFTWATTTTAQLASAPANGARVEVRRITPAVLPLVDFTDGSTIVAADLDTSNLQHLYIEQELDDGNKQAIYVDPATGQLTAGNQKITNVTNPTNAQDAATKAYVDSVVTTGVPDGDKGDIIVLGAGSQWTIDTGVVGNTKLAPLAVTADKIDTSAFTNSVSSTSTSTIATPNSVKTAYDLANAALPKSGGTVSGATTFQDNVTLSGTGFLRVPVGTTAQRPTPSTGYIRFNTDTAQFEGYGAAWGGLGGGAKGASTDQVFFENDQVVTTNYTITTNKNAVTAGPVTINAGVVVTIPSGSTWSIV